MNLQLKTISRWHQVRICCSQVNYFIGNYVSPFEIFLKLNPDIERPNIHVQNSTLVPKVQNTIIQSLSVVKQYFSNFINKISYPIMSNQQLIDAGNKTMNKTDQAIERTQKVISFSCCFLL